MNDKLLSLYKKLQKRGLTEDQDRKIRAEIEFEGTHDLPADEPQGTVRSPAEVLYGFNDLQLLQAMNKPRGGYINSIRSIDELMERDKWREEDGFPPKIRVGRLIKPGKGGKDKVVVVPSTVEEKFLHDNSFKDEAQGEGESSGGTGDGEQGEVIGEQPVREEGQAGAGGAGQGEEGPHEMESNAYDLGKILTEKFELPNLKDKGKKRALTRYTYDLTDKHRGFGQILDKKATLRKIVETNISLGRVPDQTAVDPAELLIAPSDRIYRVLSREKDYESQAMVFFVRDYSGSMSGKPSELVVAQHVLIYSWLLYQYDKQVETRFVVHDTEAKEVKDFYTYYNSKVAGGTQVASAYRLVNEIVTTESLEQDYNLYVFHGTDGDDWDTGGKESVPELKKMLNWANRIGITIAERTYGSNTRSEVEKYIRNSGLLEDRPELLRMDVLPEDSDEPRLIKGIKKLIS